MECLQARVVMINQTCFTDLYFNHHIILYYIIIIIIIFLSFYLYVITLYFTCIKKLSKFIILSLFNFYWTQIFNQCIWINLPMNMSYLLNFSILVKCIFSRLIIHKDKKCTICYFMLWFYEIIRIMHQLFIRYVGIFFLNNKAMFPYFCAVLGLTTIIVRSTSN